MWGPRRRTGTGRTRAAAGGNPSSRAEEHHTHPSPGNASSSPGYTPSRTNFYSLSALDARHQVFLFPGSFAGNATPGTTSGRHQGPPHCSMRCPSQATMPGCPGARPLGWSSSDRSPQALKPTGTDAHKHCDASDGDVSLQNFSISASVRGAHNEWATLRRAAHPHRLRPRGYFEGVPKGSPQRGKPQPDAIPRMGTGARGELEAGCERFGIGPNHTH